MPASAAGRSYARHVFNSNVLRSRQLASTSLNRPTARLLSRNLPLRRYASSASEERKATTNIRDLTVSASIVLATVFGFFYLTDTRSAVHRYLVVPAIRFAYPDAEDAHHFGNFALKALYQFGLHPRERSNPDQAGDLAISVFGHDLANPIGISGGLDKNASIPNPLFALGPAIVEVGGITPRPQEGNSKPRVFRIPSQSALINRYGLNSAGADHVAAVLRYRVREYARSMGWGYDAAAEQRVLDGEANAPPGSLMPGRLLAVQIAKNKTTPENDIEAVKADYVQCVDLLAKYADILVVNVSSPNTPGLRSLQATAPLTELLKGVVGAAKNVDRKTRPAVMVKVSPDEDSDEQIAGICEAVWESGVDGVIVGNTTKQRPSPSPKGYKLNLAEEQTLLEQGGYSGPQLFDKTVALVKRYRTFLDVRPPLSGPSSTEVSSTSGHQLSPRGTSGRNQSMPIQDYAQEGTTAEKAQNSVAKIAEAIEIEALPLRDRSDLPSSENQHLVQPPNHHESAASMVSEDSSAPKTNASAKRESPSASDTDMTNSKQREASIFDDADVPKVIFATGGITNGKQALEVLNAGASVAMVYTAIVYGGVGTISRIKGEMRQDIKSRSRNAP